MGNLKLRFKLGGDEFEAEGPSGAVLKEAAEFRKRRGMAKPDQPDSSAGDTPPKALAATGKGADNLKNLESLFKVDAEGNLSLRAKLPGEDTEADAATLLLYGYQKLKGLDSVTAVRLIASMKVSGYQVARIDRALEPYRKDGTVMIRGAKRGRRYFLSNTGEQKGALLARQFSQAIHG